MLFNPSLRVSNSSQISNRAQVRTENRSQLLPLALVSHDFYHLVMPLLYRSISICLDPQEHHFEPTKALVKRLIVSNTNLLNVIRFVDVYNDDEPLIPSSEHAIFKDPRRLRDQVVLDQLIDVIPRLRNLVSLNWRVCWGIPEALLLSMRQKCPSARLSVGFDSCLVGPDFNTVVELAGPMLHELKIILGYHGDSQETNSKLVWGLKRCPNLKVLYMQLAEASMTQLIDPPEHHLEFQPSDLLPRVSKLSVDERIFTLQNLSSWAKLDGLTQLKEVTLRNHHPLPHLRGCEKTLRSINLIQASGITPGEWGFRHEPGHSSSDIEKGLVEICSRLKCLQTLKVCGTHSTTIPTQALRICGGNLKTLEIHTLSTNRNLAGENPTIQTLETVRQCCPNIATLGVDMNRTNNTWVCSLPLPCSLQMKTHTEHHLNSRMNISPHWAPGQT